MQIGGAQPPPGGGSVAAHQPGQRPERPQEPALEAPVQRTRTAAATPLGPREPDRERHRVRHRNRFGVALDPGAFVVLLFCSSVPPRTRACLACAPPSAHACRMLSWACNANGVVAMSRCYGWLLWVVAMGGCYGWMLSWACNANGVPNSRVVLFRAMAADGSRDLLGNKDMAFLHGQLADADAKLSILKAQFKDCPAKL